MIGRFVHTRSRRQGGIRFVLTLVVLAVLAIASETAAAAPRAAASHATTAKTIQIRVNNDAAPDSIKGLSWRYFQKQVKKYLGNKAAVTIYDNATLYDQNHQVAAVQQNNVQFASSDPSLLTSLVPQMSAFSLPYMITGPEMLSAVWNNPLTARGFRADLTAVNLQFSGTWLNGFRMLGATRPVQTLDDLKGLKIRVPGDAIDVSTWTSLGTTPTPLNFAEVPQALQTHLLDAIEPTANAWASQGFDKEAKYLTYSNHVYSSYVIITSSGWWKGLPKNIRAGLSKALAATQKWNWAQTSKVNNDAIKQMRSEGAVFYTLPPAQLKQWQAATRPVWNKFESSIGSALFNQLVKLHDKYNRG